jgi:hypothetical protein
MGEGDRAVLYVGRGAFHNPTRDKAYLDGLAAVLAPNRRQAVAIRGEEFTWTVPVGVDLVCPNVPARNVHPLMALLFIVCRQDVSRTYFRSSRQENSEVDFQMLAALGCWESRA